MEKKININNNPEESTKKKILTSNKSEATVLSKLSKTQSSR